MISISLCTAAQDWTAHLSNPLSFGGGRRDVGVGVRLMKCWGDCIRDVVFFIRAVFVVRVEQCLVKLKISSDVEVVIPFDVSVHKVRLKVVFGILRVDLLTFIIVLEVV